MTLQAVLKESYLREQPADAARCLEAMPGEELRKHILGISSTALVTCMDYLTGSRAAAIFGGLTARQQRAGQHGRGCPGTSDGQAAKVNST